MNLNQIKKNNYNSVVKLLIVVVVINCFMTFSMLFLNFMFYRANFSNNVTQIVNVDTTPKFDKIDINSCSKEALDSLEGIGSTKANKIMSNRPYSDIYELRKAVGQATFDKIKNKVKVGD